MDLLDFEAGQLYFDEPIDPAARDAIEEAPQLYGKGRAEHLLLRANFLEPEHPLVLVARYRYFNYQHHFEAPELRTARHILITVNPDYVENTRLAAMARMQEIAGRLRGRANRFHDMARRYSECPTAMEGGCLGEVRRGTLYPELDAELFRVNEGEVSGIVESEIGLHILLCEKIKPGRRTSYSKAAPRVRAVLEEQGLIRILTEPRNALARQYKRLFEFEGVQLDFTDDALLAIARKALQRGTGARGLRGVMEGLLRKTMFELPSLEGASECLVDEAAVNEEAAVRIDCRQTAAAG